MKPKTRITKKGKIGKTPKEKGDLFDDVDLTTSPFHKMVETGVYVNKKGVRKGYTIFKKRNLDEEKDVSLANNQINTKNIEKNKLQQKILLYFNNTGDLYKEPRSKRCYALSGKRYKILKHFVDNKIYSFLPTKEIAADLGKNDNNLRKEINKINPLAKDKLKIKNSIIEGRKGSGYRLNPNYKIISKND